MTTSTRRILSIAAASAVVLVLIWYGALMRPQSHDLAAAHKAHAAAEQKIGSLDAQIAGLQALVKQIPADRARLRALDAALPDAPTLDGALDQLQHSAARAGVSLSAVTPSTPASATGGKSSSSSSSAPTAPGGPAVTLGLTATGSYPALTAFLRAIDTMPRALVVDSLSLSSGASELSAAISARIFYTGKPTP